MSMRDSTRCPYCDTVISGTLLPYTVYNVYSVKVDICTKCANNEEYKKYNDKNYKISLAKSTQTIANEIWELNDRLEALFHLFKEKL